MEREVDYPVILRSKGVPHLVSKVFEDPAVLTRAREGAPFWPPITTQPDCPVSLQFRRGALMSNLPEHFQCVGSGISQPRVVTLYDQRGKMHKQMLKGDDDSRSDQIFQQLFGLLNQVRRVDIILQMSWFAGDASRYVRWARSLGYTMIDVGYTYGLGISKFCAREPGLCVHHGLFVYYPREQHQVLEWPLRTYAVLPLSPGTCVIEWVLGSCTFASFLTDGEDSAHRRYFPEDKKYEELSKVFKPTFYNEEGRILDRKKLFGQEAWKRRTDLWQTWTPYSVKCSKKYHEYQFSTQQKCFFLVQI